MGAWQNELGGKSLGGGEYSACFSHALSPISTRVRPPPRMPNLRCSASRRLSIAAFSDQFASSEV